MRKNIPHYTLYSKSKNAVLDEIFNERSAAQKRLDERISQGRGEDWEIQEGSSWREVDFNGL